jgi:DNA-binding NarL/FixJ family response regulator
VTVRTAVATDDGWSSRVLIVADGWAAIDMIERRLEGTSLHVAANRAEAISFLDEPDVDVVVIHELLPDSDGLALAREVLDRSPHPTVVMVGRAYRESLIEALTAGVREWVSDDYVYLDDIVEAIERAARGG